MKENEDLAFIWKHKRNGAVFDANLLLVYVVGKFDRRNLSRCDKTQQYEEDYPFIERLVEFFDVVHTIPNVLTEVSNLGSSLGVPFYQGLRSVINVMEERYCISREAAGNSNFARFGLTDTALLNIGKDVLIVTTDWRLHLLLRQNGRDAVNFNHLRPFFWTQPDRLR